LVRVFEGEDALIWVGQAVSPAPAKMPEYRRRLPHFHPDDTCLFLTWRLWGSLPPKPLSHRYPTPGHAFVAADRILHRDRSGPLWLGQPRIARLVMETLVAGENERGFYELSAWVIMPNHVHLLILPKIAVLRRMIDASGRSIALSVDGGITPETAPRAIAAGADTLVAGTSVFKEPDYAAAIAALRGAGRGT